MTLAPGILIAAPRSGSGKTTVTLGLQRAFVRRGLRVRGLKSGPDYIDPAFHAAATGAPSFNLDSFAMPADLIRGYAAYAAGASDLVIAEGSMGLFDGVRAEVGQTGASADVAALTDWPVVLVIDVSGQAQSAAAVALGCARFDPRITVAGVILNKVASARHERLVRDGMARIGLPVFGALGKETGLILPERHLGLVQAGETADLDGRLDRLADAVTASVDLDAVLAAARPTLPAETRAAPGVLPPGERIAIARDEAFSFVYPHLEAAWREGGATLVPFSPLADEAPPEGCDACWLPGGYPELHTGRLAAAERFRAGMRRFAETRPVHGECGGYMVLGETLTGADGVEVPMLGLLPLRTSFAQRRMNLGYRIARLREPSALGPAGAELVGHEFHYATVLSEPAGALALAEVTDAEGAVQAGTGHRAGNVSGTFFHVVARRR
ncbi:cobyrinate a,c-diamide synthase [Chthonobacter albigriseus]|uniref:cobyrinate a,c-diamide synthase n=1 Tax=Chthonobacter albigriseus TaxID=1683161 RepID=UPI0015EE5EC4|nr:cobyrinate a,c-diamide synthase [Chthonobacter albigriseus]